MASVQRDANELSHQDAAAMRVLIHSPKLSAGKANGVLQIELDCIQ